MSTDVSPALAEAVGALRLVDHHVHSSLAAPVGLEELGGLLSESDRPPAPGTSPFDSQVAYAVRAHCAPLLDLDPHVPMEDYVAARAALPVEEVDRRLLGAAGVDRWLIDTGFRGDALLDLPTFGSRVPGASVEEVVRLESVLEGIARDGDAASLELRFVEALATASAGAIGLKSVIAYRHGFDFDPARPTTDEVREAASHWLAEVERSDAEPRVDHPVLLRMALWHGIDTGLPLQLHVGFGDPDLDLHRCDPLLLTEWLRLVEPTGTPVMLLHCYPFQRQAGFLAHAFPHVYLDVGLAVNYVGAAAPTVIAESLELAPFTKVLYSSDAWGPSELHLLGAQLWRRGMTTVLSRWVEDGEWSVADAVRVATLVGRENAERAYGGRRG
ncbi:amidohydrolase family protein [Nocardioides sp. J54]|uniref:amidohydrolase family protein n=1 Tax=Nocardioides sp. J54 TaxID=935866 RepID=UPI000490DC4E|nr:amidohydrolase family protein [Nocardioides sp. J54]